MENRIVTLDEFIIHRQKEHPFATGELTGLLRDIGVAAKIVNREVNKAGLLNILGAAGKENKTGDSVQKLDLYANEKLIECLRNSGECAGIASEESEDFIPIPAVEGKESKYVVVVDPLDGSSNIDVNVDVSVICERGLTSRVWPFLFCIREGNLDKPDPRQTFRSFV